MDSLGWSPWRINQHGEDESFIELDDDMFSSVQLHLAKTGLIHAAMNSNSERLSHIQMANQLATAANIAAVAKLGVSTDWDDSLSTDLSSNYSIPSPLMTGFHGNRYGGVSISNNSVSLESLDCYSNTDDGEDEGIKNLWSNISGISSGDSVTKEAVDETISHCSSEKRAIFSIDQGHQIGFSDHDQRKSKKPRSEKAPSSSNINFKNPNSSTMDDHDEPDSEAIAQMKGLIYRAAAFRPVNFGEEASDKPKRKNVRVSRDPQTVAARQRREKISEKIRVLQKMVPGGNKMDTASMLDEAANYLKFLISQVKELEKFGSITTPHSNQIPFSLPDFNHPIFPMHAQYFPYNLGSILHHQEKR